jgi:hypothetical protein
MALDDSDKLFRLCDHRMVFPSALYHTYYLDERMSPDLSLSL